jgi:3-phosphoshikimate 1-carboxyvinyltransferase
MRALGVRIDEDGDDRLIWPGPLASPSEPIDCGNSGTTMRLLAGIIASQPGIEAVLTGDESLSRRPMGRVAEPLAQMGAEINGERAPLHVRGSRLCGISFFNHLASAQVKSCVLLAGLNAEGETSVEEPVRSRDHTERMLRLLGAPFEAGEPAAKVRGGEAWTAPIFMPSNDPAFDHEAEHAIRVPPDISSAAFWMVGAAIVPGSEIEAVHGLNPTRDGILDVLAQAGAEAGFRAQEGDGWEPEAVGIFRHGPGLKPFTISGSLVPRLIDEIPILCILASQCEGVSRIRDARELRVKESDRLAQMAAGLRSMGAEVEEFEDGLDLHGRAALRGAEIHAHGDHRIAMSFAIAGLIASGETVIHGAETIATSYPSFADDLERMRAG